MVELHEEHVRRERRDAAPAMPVVHEETEEQRARLTTLYWDKLDEVTHDQFAFVARVVSQADIDRTPEAKAAMDKEWQKLVDKSCWLEKKVREYRDVAREQKTRNQRHTLVGFLRSARRRVRSTPKDTLNRSGKAAVSSKVVRCRTKMTIMRSLRNSGLAPHRWRPRRSLTFMGANRTSRSNKQTLGKPTRKPGFRALKLGLDFLGADGRMSGKDSKTPCVLSCLLFMDIRIQGGSGRTTVPLNWRAMVGFKFFLKYGRAFSTTQILSFSWSYMSMILRWPGLGET